VGKVMRIRRADRCARCSTDLPAGIEAVWLPAERVVHCLTCAAVSSPAAPRPASTSPAPPPDPSVRDAGQAGGSAQREYERRAAREIAAKQQRVAEDAEWRATLRRDKPILGRIVTAVTPRPQITPESQATTAWKVGADGERRVAEVLADVDGIAVLHDRLMPASRANIDHLVIGPAGVHVIDAKKYTGAVEVREAGTLFRSDPRLYVNGRDRTSVVDGVEGQVDAVRSVLGDRFGHVPVHGVLCFVGCEWGWIMRPKHVRAVTAVWPLKLPEHVAAPGPHGDEIAGIAAHLRQRLRAAPAT
jgi:hypothetical protein